ncbi:uncharacterized protein [Centruroides vittatus]|uniref:uncharacterized protein n=1 Tax=Centruroides vittatus TaxID=120091 RepID=UPI00350EACD2
MRRIHGGHLQFECRICGIQSDSLKELKRHQARSNNCSAQLPSLSPNSTRDPKPRSRICNVGVVRSHRSKDYGIDEDYLASQGTLPATASPTQTNTPVSPATSNVITNIGQDPVNVNNTITTETQVPSPAISSDAPPMPTQHPRRRRHRASSTALTTSQQSATSGGNTPDLQHPSPAHTSPIAISTEAPSPVDSSDTLPPLVRRPRRRRRRASSSSPPASQQSATSGTATTNVQVRPLIFRSPAGPPSPASPPTGPIGTAPSNTTNEPTVLPHLLPPTASSALTEPGSRTSTIPEAPTWAIQWCDRFNVAIDGDMLDVMVEDLVCLAQNICAVSDTTIQTDRHLTSRTPIAEDARRLQRLYQLNRRKAMDHIISGQPRYCRIDGRQLHTYFNQLYATEPRSCLPTPDFVPPGPHPELANPLAVAFTPSEVCARLRRCRNTAPGPGGLRYHHWTRVDPHGHILSSVFNAVLRTSSIPSSWQSSNTILIHKKGALTSSGTEDPSPSQTLWGFLRHKGCLDHNFLLQSIIQDARKKHKNCHIAWLDIRNAFGSVPHSTIIRCLQWCGLQEKSTEIVGSLLRHCFTKICTDSGYTEAIPILSGVKQRCPLSPLLFNIVTETTIRSIQRLQSGYDLAGENISILAYADDLVLVSPTSEGLQSQLDCISNWADWAGLQFNPGKCATLSIAGKSHCTSGDVFQLQQATISPLEKGGSYTYLGIPTGGTTHHTREDVITKLQNDIRPLDDSKLAPWQKLDAINTLLLPRLTFHLLLGSNPKKRLDNLDRQIKKAAKRWLNLPQRASAELVHIPYDHGGGNITRCSTLSDICEVTHGVHLLSSRNPKVKAIALTFLRSVVRKRIRRDPSDDNLCTYLNGSMVSDFGYDPADITSTWTRLRKATRKLQKSMDITWTRIDDTITISSNGLPIPRHAISKVLTGLTKKSLLHNLLRKPDQGKAYKLTAQHPASNHFLRDGPPQRSSTERPPSFWQLLHQMPQMWLPEGNLGPCSESLSPQPTSCHRAPQHDPKETLLTINDPNISIRCNQKVPGFDDNCRPDLVATNEATKTVTIVDVAIPFENGHDAFNQARNIKTNKYAALTQFFRAQGYDTFCDAFVIGSLGGYDPGNIAVLQRLGIGRKYSKTMTKLMVSDSIRWSRDIYLHHLGFELPVANHTTAHRGSTTDPRSTNN